MSDKIHVNTRVRCINKTTGEFFDRDFRVDLSTLSEVDAPRIFRLTKERPVYAADFLPVRSLFLIDQGLFPEDIDNFASLTGFHTDDYFEDEDGNPLEQIGLAQILSGEEYPVLLYDVRSVLRLGPTGVTRKEQWNTEASNTLAHFYQLVEIIGNSDWLKSPLSINTPGSGE